MVFRLFQVEHKLINLFKSRAEPGRRKLHVSTSKKHFNTFEAPAKRSVVKIPVVDHFSGKSKRGFLIKKSSVSDTFVVFSKKLCDSFSVK